MANLKPYGKMTVMNNIQVGDIVYRKATGGALRSERLDRSQIGLVVGKHKGYEDELSSGASLIVPQYKVKFNNSSKGKWFYEGDLYKITRTHKEDQ